MSYFCAAKPETRSCNGRGPRKHAGNAADGWCEGRVSMLMSAVEQERGRVSLAVGGWWRDDPVAPDNAF